MAKGCCCSSSGFIKEIRICFLQFVENQHKSTKMTITCKIYNLADLSIVKNESKGTLPIVPNRMIGGLVMNCIIHIAKLI